MKKVAIVQSNYIPWKGYFDLIATVDEFILLDEVQYTKADWRNRNKIKTKDGLKWLSIPVETKGKYLQRIDETLIAAPWAEAHWLSLEHAYKKASSFAKFGPQVKALYEQAAKLKQLSEVNHLFLSGICQMLGISTPLRWSTEFKSHGDKTERLVSLCKATGADVYLSGPSARGYLQSEPFEQEGIALEWMNYDGYLEYPQLWGDFVQNVSILDLLFNCGEVANRHMKVVQI